MVMVGEEDASSSWGHYQASNNNNPKKYWRSASWSASRSSDPDNEDKDAVGLRGNLGSNGGGQGRRFPAPLTPRSQQNCKARSCLPPLQPLAIARRSLDEWPRAGSDDIGEWPGPTTPGVSKSGDRLKLDLSSIQKNSDKSGGLVKKDKIAFFDKECSKVAEHIYLGGDAVAKDRDILKKNGITHVLNCVGFVCPEYFKADFVYRTLWLQDSPSEDITSILYDVFDYFEDVREGKGRVFVHCCQGVSRSTSLVIAYLMWREGQSFDDAFQYVKEARGIADPNMGFACQLLQCQKRVHAFPLSPSSLLRMYRMTPHSPYDPLHLVPKMLNDPSAVALDSRGAFIVQVPCAIYVWIGKNCHAIMERDARGAVCQIVRYERVQVPVHVFKEGEEPSFFWDTLSEFVMDKFDNDGKSAKLLPGERIVELYNVDYEIFQKAISGGFVPAFASSEAEVETHVPAWENSWSVLRRKFASGHMKDFVLAPKLVVNKLHSDPGFNYHHENFLPKSSQSSNFMSLWSFSSQSPSSVSSASSLSTSSQYLSPDSVSSDSTNNSKYSSESPLESPLNSSSPLSSFSNMSLSSKSCGNVSNHPDYIEVNFVSQPPQRTSISSRRSPLSIAERRGSLSKCLILPVVDDETRIKNPLQNNVEHQEAVKMNNNSSVLLSSENREYAEDSTDLTNDKSGGHEELVSGVVSCDLNCQDGALCSDSDKSREEHSVDRNNEAKVPARKCDEKLPLVYQFPSLEEVSTFRPSGLDSKSALVIAAPRAWSCRPEDKSVYLWMGRSFSFDRSSDQADNRIQLSDVGLPDWNQVGCDILSRLGFMDSDLKIIKEGEEPADFLAILSTL